MICGYFYSFTEEQNKALDELLANSAMLAALAGDLTISDATAKKLLADLPADLDPERRAVVEAACRLVGKVNYFWGGEVPGNWLGLPLGPAHQGIGQTAARLPEPICPTG